MTEKDIVNVLYRDGYHAAAKLIEKKSETIESCGKMILPVKTSGNPFVRLLMFRKIQSRWS